MDQNRASDPELLKILEMISDLRDRRGGIFSRYSTDGRWSEVQVSKADGCAQQNTPIFRNTLKNIGFSFVWYYRMFTSLVTPSKGGRCFSLELEAHNRMFSSTRVSRIAYEFKLLTPTPIHIYIVRGGH